MKKIAFTIFIFLVLVSTASAAVEISTSIPGVSKDADPCGIVFGFYKFALMIGGILAFAAIVYGGVKYTFAAGNPGGQSEGKEWVKGALLGLLLLVGAYFILNIINPELTKCTLPKLAVITAPPASTSTSAFALNCNPTSANMGTCKNCFASPSLNTLLSGSCLPQKIKNSVGEIAGGQHTCNPTTGSTSCHFGGRTCSDGSHAFDIKRSLLASNGLTVPAAEALLKLAACPGITTIRCELGSAPVACSSADHIHVNVDNGSCGCN